MKFHTLAATFALTASITVASAAHAAPATNLHSDMHGFFGKPHKVTLTLENDCQEPMTLKAGTQEWTLQPGKDARVKLDAGEKVVVETASSSHAAGDVVVQATNDLDGATIRIK